MKKVAHLYLAMEQQMPAKCGKCVRRPLMLLYAVLLLHAVDVVAIVFVVILALALTLSSLSFVRMNE